MLVTYISRYTCKAACFFLPAAHSFLCSLLDFRYGQCFRFEEVCVSYDLMFNILYSRLVHVENSELRRQHFLNERISRVAH